MIRFDSQAAIEGFTAAAMEAMEDIIDLAERNAQSNCPTAGLRETIEAHVKKTTESYIRGYVQAGSKEEYTAIYYERGTGIHADPKRKPRNYNIRRSGYPSEIVPRGKGNVWYDLGGGKHPGADRLVWTDESGKKRHAASVEGIKATHWLENSIRNIEPEINRRLEELGKTFDFARYLVVSL